MLRMTAIAAMFALVLPTLAAAEEPHHQGAPAKAPPPARPAVVPHGPPPGGLHPGPGPGPGPHGAPFVYHGHPFNPVHAAPFAYPAGWGYRRWGIGMALPALFLVPAYYYGEWAALGLAPPEPGFQWVRYGPDLLLVNVTTGQVVDVVYGAFY